MDNCTAKVLIVEDEAIIAEDIRFCLISYGYSVCGPVDSGVDAFQTVENEHPDIALIDINIKGNLDGTEVGKVLRERYGIPFIYLTAYEGEQTLEKVKPTDPSGYIVKPYNERELRTVIELALHKEKTQHNMIMWYEWLSNALSSIGEAVIATDSMQKIIFMNRSAELLTGWKRLDAVGTDLKDVLNIDFKSENGTLLEHVDEFYPNHLTLARVKNAILHNKKLNQIPIDYTVTPIAESDGEGCSGVVVVARDAAGKAVLAKDLLFDI